MVSLVVPRNKPIVVELNFRELLNKSFAARVASFTEADIMKRKRELDERRYDKIGRDEAIKSLLASQKDGVWGALLGGVRSHTTAIPSSRARLNRTLRK